MFDRIFYGEPVPTSPENALASIGQVTEPGADRKFKTLDLHQRARCDGGNDMRSARAGMGDKMRKHRNIPYVMLVLAFIGIADAFYDSYAIYNGQQLR